jgi:malonyl-CoA O-methyltransferase
MPVTPPPEESPVPGLDAVAARRWRLRPREDSPWLHEEVAARMAERLRWIKSVPQHWVDWAPLLGGLQGHQAVAAQYPQARVTLAAEGAQAAAERLRVQARSGWKPWRWSSGPSWTVHPEPESADLLWANMALHLEDRPRQLLRRWHAALRVDGFLMFSCLGPDSLKELRLVFEREGWPVPTPAYTDMHDWGDMLVEVGFAEPVMDMERIVLTYPNARRLLQDLRDGGRNFATGRFAGLRGRGWLQALEEALERGLPRDAAGQLVLTVEVVYGHAFKAAPRVRLEPTSTVSVQDFKAMLRRPRGD